MAVDESNYDYSSSTGVSTAVKNLYLPPYLFVWQKRQ